MKAKKLLAIFLALSMLLASVPAAGFTALAGTEEDLKADIWDGTVDTSWYDAANVATEYHFTTPEQLAGLAALVNLDTSPVVFSTSTTFYLDNDLYLNGISDYENWGTTPPQNNWIPIQIREYSEFFPAECAGRLQRPADEQLGRRVQNQRRKGFERRVGRGYCGYLRPADLG